MYFCEFFALAVAEEAVELAEVGDELDGGVADDFGFDFDGAFDESWFFGGETESDCLFFSFLECDFVCG